MNQYDHITRQRGSDLTWYPLSEEESSPRLRKEDRRRFIIINEADEADEADEALYELKHYDSDENRQVDLKQKTNRLTNS